VDEPTDKFVSGAARPILERTEVDGASFSFAGDAFRLAFLNVVFLIRKKII